MKVECLPHSTCKNLITVLCDGDPWRHLHMSIFGRKPALPAECPSIDDLEQLLFSLEYKQAKLFVLKLLSMRSLPSPGLERVLRQRLVSEENITRLIEECCQAGYVNDDEWTASFVRGQTARKRGPKAIVQKLAAKGISKAQVDAAMQSAGGVDQQKEMIEQLLAKKYKDRDLSDFREKQKVIASLVRRGFDLSVVIDSL